MRRRTGGLLLAVALGAAACAPASADESSSPATASSTTEGAAPASDPPPTTVADGAETVDADERSGGEPVTEGASRAEDDGDAGPGVAGASTSVPIGAPTSDPASVASAAESAADPATNEPQTTDPAASDPQPGDPVPADEPTFDVEPLAPLDLSAAVFAVDDAGIGGSVPAEPEAGPAGPGPAPTGWAAFDSFLADALIRDGNTAASVAVSIGGDVVHSAAFGWRTLDMTDPAEPGDRFRIASISKTLTAIALLQLVEDGVVGLDEPVGERVASMLGIEPTAGAAAITVRRLLTHTTGFGKYDGVFFRKQSDDCRHAATIGMRSGVGGGGYRYSNMNYCVAGLLLEALTGRSYETVVYEQVLTPLGISGMRLAPTFDPGPDEIEHYSTPGRNYMETLGAAGSWLASPEDLVTVMNSLDLTTPGWKPLELDTLLEMRTSVNGGFDQRGYGMGLLIYGPGRHGHTGTIESTHAMVANRGDGVIWAITVAGPYPASTPRLESIINQAFDAGGFVAG